MGSKLQIKEVGEEGFFFAINFKRGNVKQNIDYTADSIISRRIPFKILSNKRF
jgi:uncharacterized protein YggL (DUF469 family)